MSGMQAWRPLCRIDRRFKLGKQPDKRGTNLECLRHWLQHFPTQAGANGLYLQRRQIRQIGQRALANLVALAVGLTKQHGRGRFAVWDDVNVHAYYYSKFSSQTQVLACPHMETKKTTHCVDLIQLFSKTGGGNRRNFRLGKRGFIHVESWRLGWDGPQNHDCGCLRGKTRHFGGGTSASRAAQ